MEKIEKGMRCSDYLRVFLSKIIKIGDSVTRFGDF